MNLFTATGHIGKDAATRTTPSGKSVTGFSVAVKSGYGDNEKTVWVDCGCWGDRYQKLAPYLTKGTLVAVSGELSTFEADNGKTYLKLRVNDVTLCGNKPQTTGAKPQAPTNAKAAPVPADYSAGLDDDIPF